MAHVDEHDVAVAVESRRVPDRLDDAGRGGVDVERTQRADVDAGMPLGAVVAEPARDRSVGGPDSESPRPSSVCAAAGAAQINAAAPAAASRSTLPIRGK